MTATNHAMTGAIIGLTLSNPVIAVVAAFLSHFVLDAIPHFGIDPDFYKTKPFRILLAIDTLLCVGLVAVLFSYHHTNWFVPALAAFAAASPDLWSFKRFYYARKHKPYTPGYVARFASKIQWFERPLGAVVEVAWAASAIIILAHIL